MTSFRPITPLGDYFQKGFGLAMRAIDQLVAHRIVEPQVGDIFYTIAKATHPNRFVTSYPLRIADHLLQIIGGRLYQDQIGLNLLERQEHIIRHLVLSATIAPLVTGFLFSANPAGIRLDPKDLMTVVRRYFELLERDAQNAGKLFPRKLLGVAFDDLDGQEVMKATYETRRLMMTQIDLRQGHAKSRENHDVSRYPSYFLNFFHWRDWFRASSALSWDSQTEILFMGLYAKMQRAVLPAVIATIEQAHRRRYATGSLKEPIKVAEIGGGTGTFAKYLLETIQDRGGLDVVHLGFIEMSPANQTLAKKRLLPWGDRVTFHDFEATGACAENLPYSDNSCDGLVSINLFHELPPEVRRQTATEISRTLRPGGRLIFADSIQLGDGADSLLHAFGESGHGKTHRMGTFHEPYIPGYIREDLNKLFGSVGLRPVGTTQFAYLAKIMVFEKPTS